VKPQATDDCIKLLLPPESSAILSDTAAFRLVEPAAFERQQNVVTKDCFEVPSVWFLIKRD